MASILIRTVIIYVILTATLKVMGKRQIGELEIGELVSTLLISELAAIPIDDPDIPLMNALLPILFIFSLEIILTAVKNKSDKMKKFMEGEPVYIIYKGRLIQRSLVENRMSINELLSEMRLQGVGNITDIRYALLEQNGGLSILKCDSGGDIAHNLIIDTVVQEDILKILGLDKTWLDKTLKKEGARQSEVFLMTVDDAGEINIIKKEKK